MNHQNVVRLALPGLLFASSLCFAQGQVISTITRDITVGPGDYAQNEDPPCNVRSLDHDAQIAGTLAAGVFAAKFPELKLLSPVVAGVASEIVGQSKDWIRTQGGDLAKALVPDRYANCTAVAVKLPQNCPWVQYNVTAGNQGGGTQACDLAWTGNGRACEIGWSAFTFGSKDGMAVVTFKNWSHNLTRVAHVEFVCMTSQ